MEAYQWFLLGIMVAFTQSLLVLESCWRAQWVSQLTPKTPAIEGAVD